MTTLDRTEIVDILRRVWDRPSAQHQRDDSAPEQPRYEVVDVGPNGQIVKLHPKRSSYQTNLGPDAVFSVNELPDASESWQQHKSDGSSFHSVPKGYLSEGTGMSLMRQDKITNPMRLILRAKNPEGVAQVLKNEGFGRHSDRIRYLCEASGSDPEQDPVDFDSLRRLSAFLAMSDYPSASYIALDPDGTFGLDWETDYGVLATRFYSNGEIEYASAYRSDIDKPALHGFVRRSSQLMPAVRPFTSMLSS